jgi:predicted nucleotidyltransferase
VDHIPAGFVAPRCTKLILDMPAELESYARAWRRRFAAAEGARVARAEAARALLPALARHLADGYQARRVWLHGSLVEGGFHERSDIDLAAEGLPAGAALFRAAAELDDLATPFTVDLVPFEEAHPALRERILARGELIHDGR